MIPGQISIIIVSYNSAALLPACFASLAMTNDDNYQLIVVDNASSDGSAELVRQQYPHVQLIANQHNQGFGAACNQGMAAATGEYFLLFNPDVQITPNWLTLLRQHLATNPQAAIICPTTLYPNQALPTRQGVAITAAVPGCAMLLRRSAWQAIGGFDPAIFLYWEDTELCWRAWLLGWQVLEDFEALVVHERGGSGGGQRWLVESSKNGLYCYLKLRPWSAVLGYSLRMLAKTAIVSLRQRNLAMLNIWLWHGRNLKQTLATRRAIQAQITADRSEVEGLIKQHLARGKQERRASQKSKVKSQKAETE
ncbi:MAG TPA: glycosyltransferase family 2 protein [Herpetosiphon sp.]|uniref:Glycosyl transferase family 2 n=1 Tax=Herpetosiphon aurantiacus (strain ATCC 23779 / DSM 785 / 114-95) TaxID=316274 RepID=A9AXQ4_HERA2|nr:glycosyltransferase family 2 protein [Herpetosiphon sp.]ABX03468.1 glycosyl transferase family 2 [Herpetosiphon aurantiacus DSM 785]HBW52955.1 glycosyltransferase family 2 protein [Herpetosiphon sp.]